MECLLLGLEIEIFDSLELGETSMPSKMDFAPDETSYYL